MRIAVLFVAAAPTLLVGGCSTTGMGSNTFECGEGKDVRCASVMEAYGNATGVGPRVAPKKAVELPATVPAQGATIDDAQWPKPVLEPAQVMRIWIAPWRDASESLHWPSYVFTEVRARKWSFGQPDFRTARQLVPLQVNRRPAPDQEGAASVAPSSPALATSPPTSRSSER